MNLLIKPPQSAITAIAKAARHNSNPAGHSKTFRQPQSSFCLFLCVSVTVKNQKNQTQKERNRKAAQHREREQETKKNPTLSCMHLHASLFLCMYNNCHWPPPLKTLTLTNLSNNKSSNNHFLSNTSDKPILKVVNSN